MLSSIVYLVKINVIWASWNGAREEVKHSWCLGNVLLLEEAVSPGLATLTKRAAQICRVRAKAWWMLAVLRKCARSKCSGSALAQNVQEVRSLKMKPQCFISSPRPHHLTMSLRKVKPLAQGHTASDGWSPLGTWLLRPWTPLRCHREPPKSQILSGQEGRVRLSHGPLNKRPTPSRGSTLNGVGSNRTAGILLGSANVCAGETLPVLEGLKVCVRSGWTQNGPRRITPRPQRRLQICLDSKSVKCDLLSSEAGMGLVISKYLILLVAPSVLNRYKGTNEQLNDGQGKGSPCVWVRVCSEAPVFQIHI